MSAAEKDAYAKLCEVKREEVTTGRELSRAENAVMYLVGNVPDHRERLEPKAVLSLKANALNSAWRPALDLAASRHLQRRRAWRDGATSRPQSDCARPLSRS